MGNQAETVPRVLSPIIETGNKSMLHWNRDGLNGKVIKPDASRTDIMKTRPAKNSPQRFQGRTVENAAKTASKAVCE